MNSQEIIAYAMNQILHAEFYCATFHHDSMRVLEETVDAQLKAEDRVDELEAVLESNAKVLKTGLQTSIKNMHLHDALKSSHELLCILRTMVESCDKEINPDWTYEQLGQSVYNLLLSQEVYEDLHVENERALVIQDSATHGGTVGNE